jgi:LmbE family N-acetylglucosaminyl deacetylase
MKPASKVLIVAPHPDDAEIGMGALLSKWQGVLSADIAICAGEGDLSMVHGNSVVSFKERMEEQHRAANVLGAGVVPLGLAPASKFRTVSMSVFVNAFDKLFPQYHAVYLPLPTYNDDHNVIWEAAMAAMRPLKVDSVSFHAYEQAFSNAVGPQITGMFGKTYHPVGPGHIDHAWKALKEHKSQMSGREDSIYTKAGFEALYTLRGLEVGEPYCVMTRLIRGKV